MILLTSRFAHNLPDRWVEGNEYEGRLFGGAYSPFELKNSAPDSAKRKMIPLARERYNAIREEFGLPLVTDWSQRPVDLMHRVPAPLMSGTKCDDAPDALAQARAVNADLLAALQGIKEAPDSLSFDWAQRIARAAIAKATGGQS